MNIILNVTPNDIFKDPKTKVIAHGCNCFHAMKSGIAGYIAKRWPLVPQVDERKTIKGDREKLGSLTVARVPEYLFLNLYTQYTTWDDNDRFYLSAYSEALITAIDLLSLTYEINTMSMPAIGLGLAKGDPYEVFDEFIEQAKFWEKYEGEFEIRYHLINPEIRETFLQWVNDRKEQINNVNLTINIH